MNDEIPLFTRFPELATSTARIPLCQLPTPVERVDALAERIGCSTLAVKRDDLSAQPYGGNKVRKLEFLIGDARARGCRDIICFGFSGSNFVAACAWYAAQAGLRTHAMLLPQHNAAYLRDNLRVGVRAGASYCERGSVPALALSSVLTWVRCTLSAGRPPAWFPAGGSSPVGMLAYVNAALELAAQIEAGEAQTPDSIYVAMGSMGTAVGLRFGLHAAGIRSRVVAVRVVQKRFASADLVPVLERKLSKFLRQHAPSFPLPDQSMPAIEVRDDFFGTGYGEPTPASDQAIQMASELAGLRLDGTYSGKAMAALIDDAGKGKLDDSSTLFWCTFNSTPLGDLVDGIDIGALPERLQRYFADV